MRRRIRLLKPTPSPSTANATPAMTDDTILPFSFSAVHAKKITAAFDGGRLAGCAIPASSAGHASAKANAKLTFHLDHSVGDDHPANHLAKMIPPILKVRNIQYVIRPNTARHEHTNEGRRN
jgi:hypothetical protein